MNYISFYLFLMLIAAGCRNSFDVDNKRECAGEVRFLYFFDRPANEQNSNSRSISFTFYNQYFQDSSHSITLKLESLTITIPEDDTLFLLKNDSHGEFLYTLKNETGTIVTKKITEGVIEGALVGDGVWEIKVKVNAFDFLVLVSTQKKRRGYYGIVKCFSEYQK
jgi:hypothetical protein